jgi:phage shock protein C
LPVVIPYLTILGITRARGPAAPAKPFRRSRDNHMIAGVLGGVSEWLGVKPALVRVGYGALTIATLGLPGIVTYLVLWAKTPLSDARADSLR